MTDELDLDAIEARAEAATEGPWDAADEHGLIPDSHPAWCVSRMLPGFEELTDDNRDERGRGGGWLHDVAYVETEQSEADAEFIAHARTDVPALVALVRTLTAENKRLRGKIERVEALITEGGPGKYNGGHSAFSGGFFDVEHDMPLAVTANEPRFTKEPVWLQDVHDVTDALWWQAVVPVISAALADPEED